MHLAKTENGFAFTVFGVDQEQLPAAMQQHIILTAAVNHYTVIKLHHIAAYVLTDDPGC